MATRPGRWIRWILAAVFALFVVLGVCFLPQIRLGLLRRYAGRDILALEGFDSTAFRLLTRGFELPTNLPEPEREMLFERPFTDSPAIEFVRRADGSTALAWIEIRQAMSMPGSSHARILLVDEQGRAFHDEEFSLGYRAFSTAWRFHDPGSHGFACLEVDAARDGVGDLRLAYAIHDDRILLVRIEVDGKLAAETGGRQGELREPEIVGPTDAEEGFPRLVAELHSEFPAERLHALCELARRLAVTPDLNGRPYLVSIRKDVEKLLAGRDLDPTLDDLARSPDPWVKDAVTLVRQQLTLCRELIDQLPPR